MTLQDVFSVAAAVLVSLGGGATIVLGISSWLGKVWASRILEADRHKYQQSIATLHSELEAARFERNTRFSLLHERRATAVQELYQKLVRARRALSSLVAIFQPGGQEPLPEKKKKTADLCNEANEYFTQSRIFFEPEICESADQIFRIMHDAFIEFDVAQEGDRYEPGNTKLWKESYDKLEKLLPPLLGELEDKFRTLLGVPTEARVTESARESPAG